MSETAYPIELFIACENLPKNSLLPKSNFVAVLQSFDIYSQKWSEVSRSEFIRNDRSPNFVHQFVMNYSFEEIQKIRFTVYDVPKSTERLPKNAISGVFTTILSDLMKSKSTYIGKMFASNGKLLKSSKILIECREIIKNKDLLTLQLIGDGIEKKDIVGSADSYLEFHRLNEQNRWVSVHKTQVVYNSLAPIFDLSLPIQKLCNGDFNCKILVKVWDWNRFSSHSFIGDFECTVNGLLEKEKFSVINLHKKKKRRKKYTNSGVFSVKNARIKKIYSFIDYIKGGCQVNLIVAIDFSATNGPFDSPTSLHYQFGNSLNEYQKALESVGKVLQPYDTDNIIPLYGFGAQFGSKTSQCFALNGDDENPGVEGISGVLSAYSAALSVVQPATHCTLHKVIDKAVDLCREDSLLHTLHYSILLIVTDGKISEMRNTVRSIAKATGYPLSIIIVGVGEGYFDEMVFLDSDDKKLTLGDEVVGRDIVQFVPMRFFSDTPLLLAKETLDEIPKQLESYMTLHDIVPMEVSEEIAQ